MELSQSTEAKNRRREETRINKPKIGNSHQLNHPGSRNLDCIISKSLEDSTGSGKKWSENPAVCTVEFLTSE